MVELRSAASPPSPVSGCACAAAESWRCHCESEARIAIECATWPFRSLGKRSSATFHASAVSPRAMIPTRTPPPAGASAVSCPSGSG